MKYKSYKSNKKIKLIYSIIASVFCVVVIFFTSVMMYARLCLEYHPVMGTSMQPTLNENKSEGDFVYIKKNTDINRGDIVVYQKENETLVIKRLVALGGDWVTVVPNGKVSNGYDEYVLCIKIGGEGEWVTVDEPYVQNLTNNYKLYRNLFNGSYGKVYESDENGNMYYPIPEGSMFCIGDNRESSLDCATYGAVSCSALVGRVEYIIYGGQNATIQIIKQMLGL